MFRKYLPDGINLLLLIVASLWLLMGCNADVLYTAQSRSLCLSEWSVFCHDVANKPGGLLGWLGCWFTQLFYYPWLGASVLTLLWIITYGVLAQALDIARQWRWLLLVPLMALLVSVIDLGYWIYYLKQPGYFFRESLGLLAVGLLLWLQPANSDKKGATIRQWAAPVACALAYPLIGWYALLALAVMTLRSLMNRQWTLAGVALALGVLVPPVAIRFYVAIRSVDAWKAGFPLIESNQNLSWMLTLPFIVVAASLLVLVLVKHWPEQKKPYILQGVACAALLAGSAACNFSDSNYHTELQMYRDMEDFRWDRLITRFNDLPDGPTRQMVMCKNLALINLKHLGDGMFLYPNIGADPKVNEGLEMHIAQTAAPMFYLQHGLTNDALHWGVENSVEYGLTINDLRIMTLAAIIDGETRLANKYFNMLRHTLFGSIWAQRYFPLTVHPEWISEYPELKVMKELHDNDIEYIVSDQGDCEFRIYRHFSNTLYNPNPLFQEVSLAYTLMLKNPEIGMIQLKSYLEMHPGQKLPQYYQEAASLFQKMKNNTLTKKEVDEMIEAVHGKTYMWFYFRVNNAKTY